jgi:predicted unusual protein kinase regulating ubiquinone biosynthesis (AarF/ABC1/UbiB family)
MTEEQRIEAAQQRYFRALHAMQTGVAFSMDREPSQTQPKHLRVGVNSAMVDSAAIAQLLIDKGIITRAEHVEMLASKMEAEAESYAKKLSDLNGGANIKLS